MASRTYGQFCALARALDFVGDRWALLIVRELLTGAKRYTDLRDGLPGVSTDMLVARLRDLEAAELVTRRVLPPPAASKVYELTPDGHALEPTVLALARWGRRFLPAEFDGDFRSDWLVLSLRAAFRPEVAADLSATIDFLVGTDPLRIRIHDGNLSVDPHPDGQADVVIEADPATLTHTTGDPEARAAALREGTLRAHGDYNLLSRVQAMFTA